MKNFFKDYLTDNSWRGVATAFFSLLVTFLVILYLPQAILLNVSINSVFSCAIFLFIFLLPSVLLRRFYRFLLVIFWLLVFIPVSVATVYMVIYGELINIEHLYFIWETNLNESVEFFYYILNVGFKKILLIGFLFFLNILSLVFLFLKLKKMNPLKSRSVVFLGWGCYLFLFFLISRGFFSGNVVLNFYDSFFRYNIEIASAVDFRKNAAINIKDIDIMDKGDSQNPVYVIVIGESASRHHMSLYGYNRNTDVEMKKLSDNRELYAYNNVSSRFSGTTDSLLHALSFKDPMEGFATFKYSIVDVFNQAGFETYWISNNAVLPKKETILQAIWGNASHIYFVPPKKSDMLTMVDQYADIRNPSVKNDIVYDESLLDYFKTILSSDKSKKVIFVHLRGSHSVYWYRFPRKFEYFNDKNGISVNLSDNKIKIINEYDNSILYTDYILSQMINQLKLTNRNSWLLYFSDHGEEVFDYKDFYGRTTEFQGISKYMLDVPFFVWFSENYSYNRDLFELKKEVDRPFSLDALIYSLMELAQLESSLLNEKKSIFSKSYDIPVKFFQSSSKIKKVRAYLDIDPVLLYNKGTVSDEVEAFYLMNQ